MVTVARCYTLAEANSLKIALDANGIESFLPDDAMSGAVVYLGKSGVRIQVEEGDEQRAKTVIEEARQAAPEPE